MQAFELLLKKYFDAGLSLPEDRLRLFNHFDTIEVPRNELLIGEGKSHHYAYFIIKGAVRSHHLRDGAEVTNWFAFEQEIVGSLDTYSGSASRQSCTMMEDSSLVSINLDTIRKEALVEVKTAQFVLAIVTEYASFLEQRLEFLQFATSLEKYEFLIRNQPEIFNRVPVSYIASYLGMSRETLSRLRNWRPQPIEPFRRNAHEG